MHAGAALQGRRMRFVKPLARKSVDPARLVVLCMQGSSAGERGALGSELTLWGCTIMPL